MANLSKLNAPASTLVMPITGDVTTGRPSELAAKLQGDAYGAVRNKDGSDTLVSPKSTITDVLTLDRKHPYAKPTKADLAEQDKLIAEAGRDVDARHDAETSDLLDMMRKKQPGVRTGGMIGIRK